MDYFYAQVEILSRPDLFNKPVAIGGESQRSVVSTCNYVARKFGVKSAMPCFKARQLCPDIIFLRPNFEKYKEVSHTIFNIFYEYTDIVEGISLDEAYLDVTDCNLFQNSATLIARDIRKKIMNQTGLTASAGISFNKLLAKIASEINKPNAIFTIAPGKETNIIGNFSVSRINGVGEVTLKKLNSAGIYTFDDLRKFNKLDLINLFGSYGVKLFNYARGVDLRSVNPSRIRKSLSVENTFYEDINKTELIKRYLFDTYQEFKNKLQKYQGKLIKSFFVKIKFSDFSKTTVETRYNGSLSFDSFLKLCLERIEDDPRSIRLLGLGVRFYHSQIQSDQLSLPFID